MASSGINAQERREGIFVDSIRHLLEYLLVAKKVAENAAKEGYRGSRLCAFHVRSKKVEGKVIARNRLA
jgi:hypothetical protein